MRTASQQQYILIASCTVDKANWLPIAKILNDRGWPVIVYKADMVANGQAKLTMQIDQYDGLKIYYHGQEIPINQIAAAWLRRPISCSDVDKDQAKQQGLEADRRSLQNSIWQLLPDNIWLNSPRLMQTADLKPIQLKVARDLGFNFPTTVTSNSWTDIKSRLPRSVIYKSNMPILFIENELHLIYAKRFTNPGTLPTKANPFPGLWQSYVRKAKEWRITIVGDKCFDAAIYTKTKARDDWRKHQNREGMVEFKAETFPEVYKNLCFEYLKRFGLKYGAFDFIESEDGKITFLECNPNGQYGWLEEEINLPISKAIADLLIQIARSNTPIVNKNLHSRAQLAYAT